MDLPFDPWVLNASDFKTRIAGVTDKDLLSALDDREMTHPKYAPGRASVLNAIQERLGEIVQAEEAEQADAKAAFEEQVVPADEPLPSEPAFWVRETLKPVEVGDAVLVTDQRGMQHDAVVAAEVLALKVRIKDSAETTLVVVEGEGPLTWRRK